MKANVIDAENVVHSVDAFAEFIYCVAGQEFALVVTKPLDEDGEGWNVTHKDSGTRVCKLEDIGLTQPDEIVAHARGAVLALAQKYGTARVRSVLAGARPLPVQKFVAGWNMPGYMPEEPYSEYDSFNTARDAIVDELKRTLDDLYVQDCPREAINCENVIAWVREQTAPFTTKEVNQYIYEVQRA